MNSILVKTEAVAALGFLAAACLTMTSAPPADPALRAFGTLLRHALATPFQSLFLLGLLGGLSLLAGIVILVILAYLDGSRVDWLSLLGRRLWQMALGYCFLALLLLFLHLKGPQATQAALAPKQAATPLAPGEALPTSQPLLQRPAEAGDPPPVLLAGGLLLLGAGALGFGLRGRWGRQRPPAPPPEATLLAAVRRRLELGDQVRDAIIACYAEMGSVFSRQSPAGIRSLTAREFAALLRARGAGEPEILALTSMFEKARYSLEPCDESDRAQALAALRAIEARYGPPQDTSPNRVSS